MLKQLWLKKGRDSTQLRASAVLAESRQARRLFRRLPARLSERRDPLPPQLFAFLAEPAVRGAQPELRQLRLLRPPLQAAAGFLHKRVTRPKEMERLHRPELRSVRHLKTRPRPSVG